MGRKEVVWYQPDKESSKRATKWINSNYPYKRELDVIKRVKPREKVPALIELFERHHPNTVSHTFEVAFLATSLAFDYFVRLGKKLRLSDKEIAHRFMPQVERTFLGAMLHDIGETALPASLIDNKNHLTHEEKKLLNLHSQLGSDILRRVGLEDFAYFCDEHHIGNSNNKIFLPEDMIRRHPLTEFVGMADVLSGMRDSRRPYLQQETISDLVDKINKKHENGKFSDGLMSSFKSVIVDRNMFPPFFSTGAFEKSLTFMGLIEKHRLGDIMKRSMQGRKN